MEEKIFDPIERKEFFLANLGGQDITPPDPVTRIERYLQDIIDGNASTIPPITRMEYYLAKISGADVAIPDPVTRTEYYLAAIAGMEIDVPDPITREEYLLAEWAENSSEHTYGPASIVSFETAKAKLMKSLLINLPPIQDLHGYDNPWPAGGGKQLISYPYVQDTKTTQGITFTANSDGSIRVVSTGTGTSRGFFDLQTGNSGAFVLGAGTYTISGGNANISVTCVKVPNTAFISSRAIPETGTLEEETTVACYLSCNSSIEYDVTIYPQLEKGSSATAFAPYSNICPITGRTGANVYVSPTENVADATTYAVAFGDAGTVYGGTVDVVTGVLTVTHGYGTADKDSAWGYSSGSQRFYIGQSDAIKAAASTAYDGLCNMFTPHQGGVAIDDGSISYFGTASARICFKETSCTTVDEWKAFLGNSTITYTYPLATPVTYQLTPQEVTALVGQNVVWSDAGEVTVKV